MKNNDSPQNTDTARPIASTACKTGGLIATVMLSGLLLGACSSDVIDIGATAAVRGFAEAKTEAVVASQHQGFDHSVVNQRSTVYDSDLSGASIAAYGN